MLPKPEAYASIVESVLECIHVVSLAHLVADYAFIDTTIAAYILAKHRPVYIVNPNGWDIPAYISISPEESNIVRTPEEKTVRVRIDHMSDFPFSPEYRGKCKELYHLADSECVSNNEEIEQPISPIWTEPPMLLQTLMDPNCSDEFFSEISEHFIQVDNVDTLFTDQKEVDNPGSDLMSKQNQPLVKKLVIELGAGEDNCGKLFRMIREDIETIMAGEVPFVTRPIPFKWPPTFDDLRKKFNEPLANV